MKFRSLSLALALAALATGCTSENAKTENKATQNATENPPKPSPETLAQYDLVPGRAGQITINLPSDSLKKIVPAQNLKVSQRELEGEKYTAYEIRNAKAGNQLLMLAEESCAHDSCKIFRIRILSPKFKTKEGIRVGSAFSEVKKAYQFSYVGLGETDFVALSENQRMAFTLDISKFPPKPLYKMKAGDIPDSTVVTSILMF
jgi:hypothetical protein